MEMQVRGGTSNGHDAPGRAPAASRPRSGATSGATTGDARRELLERFLGAADAIECAEHALDWLARHAGVEVSLCASLDPEGMLFGLYGHGLAQVRVRSFGVPMSDVANPLAAALNARRPVYFAARAAPAAPLDGAFHAVPLVARDEPRRPLGLLLAEASSPRPDPEVVWVGAMLALAFARRGGSMVPTAGFAREQRLLYGIINAVTDPILLTDTEGKLIIANAHADRLFAAAEQDSDGRRRAIALNNMLFSAALSSRSLEQELARGELPLVDPSDGSDLLLELISSPLRDERGEPCIVSVLRNVTDLGRASAELEENYRRLRVAEAQVRADRHRLELIIDSVADPIVVTDPAGEITLMNDPAERLFLAAGEGGEEARRRVRTNDAHFSSFVSTLLVSGSDRRYRAELTMLDPLTADAMPVEALAGKILAENGELEAVVTILHDRREALERAQLYDQLQQASEQLKAKVQEATAELANQNELLRRQHMELELASSLKTQFLANMSHELRTPLNAVLGYTSMLLQGVCGDMNLGQRRHLLRVDSNSRHLITVINEILDITRIEAGRMPLHPTSFRVKDLIDEVLVELEPIIARSKLEMRTHLSPRVPEMESDRQKVKQVVVNILANALKFTHHGSVTVSARHDAKKDLILIEVADTGIGIAPEDHARVFEDFRQVDNSPTRAYMGTGLGLSICQRLVSMLGGQITLESAVGEGSAFTVHLPRRLKRR